MSMAVLVGALVAYAVSTALFLAHLLLLSQHRAVEKKGAPLAAYGLNVLMVGIAVHVVGKGLRAFDKGALPIVDGKEALGGLALVVAVLFVWAARRYRVPVLGAFAVPLVTVTLAASLAFSQETGAIPEALRSTWFPIHLALAISGDACFAIAGIAAVAFLVQEGQLKKKQLGGTFKLLPALPVLEEISYRFIMTGFLLLTLAMATGSVYAKEAWGAYWSWDPKQSWTLVTWVLFAAILHARVTIGWRGRRAAWATVVATALVIATLFGFNALFPTRHGGAYDGQLVTPPGTVSR